MTQLELPAIPIDYTKAPPEIHGRHVVCRVSGGVASAIVAMRCIEWYGLDRVTLVNADTCCESDGNYALVDALESVSGAPIVRLNQGKDIWDVFDEHGVMRMKNACKASVELKQKPLDEFTTRMYSPHEVVLAIGLSWTEPDRQHRLTHKLCPYQTFYPLNVTPQLSDCDLVAELERYGLPESMAYNLGFTHDNCNGGCVLAGQAQWAGLLDENPEHFAYCERRERVFYDRTGFSVLRDRREGRLSRTHFFNSGRTRQRGGTFGTLGNQRVRAWW